MSRIKTIIILVACCSAVAFGQNGAASPSEAGQNRSQPARPQAVRVPTEVMLGLVEHKTMPVYPVEAMKKGIQGDVIFEIDVDETGKITAAEPLAGDPLLVAASKDALRAVPLSPLPS